MINKFFEYVANPLAYDKPTGAGYKSCSGKNKRRTRLPEPVMFTERVVAEEPAAKSPLDDVHSEEEIDDEEDPFNPQRSVAQKYDLIHRKDTKLCPKKVTTYQSCPTSFRQSDVVLRKTYGTREFTDKTGKQKLVNGNIYLHFLQKCHKKIDKDFSYQLVHLPLKTQELCPKSALECFRKRKMKFDKE